MTWSIITTATNKYDSYNCNEYLKQEVSYVK